MERYIILALGRDRSRPQLELIWLHSQTGVPNSTQATSGRVIMNCFMSPTLAFYPTCPRLLAMALVLLGIARLKLLAPDRGHQSPPGLRQVSCSPLCTLLSWGPCQTSEHRGQRVSVASGGVKKWTGKITAHIKLSSTQCLAQACPTFRMVGNLPS